MLSTALLVLGCGSAVERMPEVDRPNLLFISIDTLRADALGAYGQRLAPSPNLDRLAADGVRFAHCSTAVPSTFPSHSTMFTGKYPFSHGVRANAGYLLDDSQITLAEVLRDAGYTTAAEVAAPVIGAATQLNQGFQQYRSTDAFDVVRKSRVTDEGVQTFEERDAGDITRHALRFIESHADETFFLWLHYFDVHSFYLPPEPFATRFSKSAYHGEVAYVDDQLARVFEALERHGIDERTLIVVTSDHGEGLGEHGEITHVFYVYDATIRVPLIVRGPGVARGYVAEEAVSTADLMPTLLDLLHVPAPNGIQGRSVAAALRGRKTAAAGLSAYGESIEPLNLFGTSPLRFVRRGSWKYIHKVVPELYDTSVDPFELNNLAEREPERSNELRLALGALVSEAAPAPDRAQTPLDPASVHQLELLGYLPTPTSPAIADQLLSIEVRPPDPTTLIRDHSLVTRAWGALVSQRPEASLPIFEELIERHPNAINVLLGLIRTYEDLERADEVEPLVVRALELTPENPELVVKLATLRARDGDLAHAEQLLRSSLELEPCASQPRILLSNLLHENQRYAEQLDVLRSGSRACPTSTDVANDYAYALATLPMATLRDGAEALQIARRIVEATSASNPALLDTLACTLAETGDFEAAVLESERALSLLGQRESPEAAVEVFRAHLETFRSGRPVRD